MADKDKYEDAYNNTVILNAGTKGAGLQNDAFNDGQQGAFDASKFFRAEGSAIPKSKSDIKGYYKAVFPPSPVSWDILYNTDGSKNREALRSGELIYNYAVKSGSDARLTKINYDGRDYFIAGKGMDAFTPVTMIEARKILQDVKVAKDMAQVEASAKAIHAEGEVLNAAGPLDRTAISSSYKSLVSNVADLKVSINKVDVGAALAYVKNAKKELEAIEKLLK